ncbi:unnamed protein product [Phaedon cochleariae]|uniref:SCY1-like protein 2 n=1 Tax=Phaedon cochleariae TaxID=80249 RepID=A0A9N9SGW8_PHACE|nr:unnamed protein product [Phaedon cochleariae]
MPATAMFSKFKSSSQAHHPCPLETNPIGQFFEMGKQVASAGPELGNPTRHHTIPQTERPIPLIPSDPTLEQIHPTSNQMIPHLTPMFPLQECSVFLFEKRCAEKLHKPKRKETVTEILRSSVRQLERFRHPKILNVLHPIEECAETLAFATEPIYASLANILAFQEGSERINDVDGVEPIPCQPWTSRLSKMAQPNLDYTAPETQTQSVCSILSDMFSLGMVICAIFNHGRPLIQAANSTSAYLKQLELLEDQVHNIIHRIPVPLQEATVRLLSKDTRQRPTAQLLTLIKFFRNTLKESLPFIPKSAALVAVTNISEYLEDAAIKRMILPKLKVIYEKNQSDLKLVSNVLSCVERTLDRLDKSQIIDEVLPLLSDIRLADPQIILRVVNIYRLMLADKKYGLSISLMATKVMPSLLPQTVNPSLNLEQFTILIEVLQDMLDQIDRNQRNKLKLDNLSLPSPERHRPLRHQFSSDNMHVPPFNIPNLRIEQRKTSSAEDMARKNSGTVLRIWPGRILEQVRTLFFPSVALDIGPSSAEDLARKNSGTGDDVFSLFNGIGHYSADDIARKNSGTGENFLFPLQFVLQPNRCGEIQIALCVTSSTEDMGRKNSGTDSNFLRVVNSFPNRRLSDNTLMTPKIRVAPSCASSPGGTPGGGLPIRRHSSIGPQERRGSTVNLSPPTVSGGDQGKFDGGGQSLNKKIESNYPPQIFPLILQGGSMPNTSSSVPFLLSSSMQSIRSRRPSAALGGSQGSQGLLQQLGSGMVRLTSSHQPIDGRSSFSSSTVRKCPSLNITFS